MGNKIKDVLHNINIMQRLISLGINNQKHNLDQSQWCKMQMPIRLAIRYDTLIKIICVFTSCILINVSKCDASLETLPNAHQSNNYTEDKLNVFTVLKNKMYLGIGYDLLLKPKPEIFIGYKFNDYINISYHYSQSTYHQNKYTAYEKESDNTPVYTHYVDYKARVNGFNQNQCRIPSAIFAKNELCGRNFVFVNNKIRISKHLIKLGYHIDSHTLSLYKLDIMPYISLGIAKFKEKREKFIPDTESTTYSMINNINYLYGMGVRVNYNRNSKLNLFSDISYLFSNKILPQVDNRKKKFMGLGFAIGLRLSF